MIFEAHVARYLDTAVLAVFATPTAHENETERAVLAALEVVEAVRSLQPDPQQRLHVRVGIGRFMRISVSNWGTTEADVDRSLPAIVAAVGPTGRGGRWGPDTSTRATGWDVRTSRGDLLVGFTAGRVEPGPRVHGGQGRSLVTTITRRDVVDALLIGYAGVSTDEQDLTAQRDALAALGVSASGPTSARV